MSMLRVQSVFMTSLALGLLAGDAIAQSNVAVIQNRSRGFAINPRMVSPTARPVLNKLAPPNTSRAIAGTTSTVPFVSPGIAPEGGARAPTANTDLDGINAFGAFGLPYTSTRVQLGATNQVSTVGANFLSTTTPYRQVGKLFINGGYCSASLIRRSVIVTAAHCIQDFGSGNAVFGGWIFVPGHYGAPGATLPQIMPYGAWNWRALARPVSWANGTDTGAGAARNNDVAVMILSKNANGQFLGDIIGWLGYAWNNFSFVASPKTGNLFVAATSTLGYPGLMDNGAIMQRADGPTYLTVVGGAFQMWQGNNFTGGSSGGPWIVNFGSANPTLSGGAVIGTAAKRAVIGVTSWGSADPNAIKDNYSSRFSQNVEFPNAAYGAYGAGNIGALLLNVCSQFESPGVTYAAAGYCN